MCCSVLQCVAVRFSLFPCVEDEDGDRQGATSQGGGVLRFVVVCFSLLQCIAAC